MATPRLPLAGCVLLAAAMALSTTAAAQDDASPPTTETPAGEPAQAEASASFEMSASFDSNGSDTNEATASDTADDNNSYLLLGLKFGGSLPFSDLSLGPIVALEAGWVFGGTKGRIAAMLDVSYTVSTAEGAADDMRVPGSSYAWKLTQKQLVLQPTFLFRLTGVAGSVVPYAGIGPRIYLLQGITEGSAGGEQLGETTEQSTKVGIGIPLGIEITLGPGGLLAELLFQYGPLTHTTTGDTNLGSVALWLGYRTHL